MHGQARTTVSTLLLFSMSPERAMRNELLWETLRVSLPKDNEGSRVENSQSQDSPAAAVVVLLPLFSLWLCWVCLYLLVVMVMVVCSCLLSFAAVNEFETHKGV